MPKKILPQWKGTGSVFVCGITRSKQWRNSARQALATAPITMQPRQRVSSQREPYVRNFQWMPSLPYCGFG